MSQCKVCRAESGLFLCSRHIKYLEDGLGEIPWLTSELQVTITKRDRLHQVVGHSDQDTRSVINFGASRLHSDVEILLADWVSRLVHDNGLQFLPKYKVPHDFIGPLLLHWSRLPRGYTPTPTRMSRWLAHHVNTAAMREDAGDLYREIIGLTGDPDKPQGYPGRLVAAINRRTKLFAGPCPTPIGYGEQGEEIACAIPLYAVDGQEVVTCKRCRHEVDVQENRQQALKTRDLMTEAQLLETLDTLDEHVPRVTFYEWLKDKQVYVHGYLHEGGIVPKKIRNSDPRVFSLAQVRVLRWQAMQEKVAS
ncbi:hypothetical protein [Mycolicibacterium vinylchloridicum]|uniref:hypothetical protein n=1 Tax=Mycolicibacterium vinylchloridicum TaxID=2736928 RepID=UPI0015CB59B3|nr:hypothetical protein [Mycolicibacterium vinylchloridicum]